MKNNLTMEDIYAGEYGYLFMPKPTAQPKTADDRLIESFQEINTFFRENGSSPKKDSKDFHEQVLSRRLLNLRNDPKKREILSDYDEFNLLQLEEAPKSLSDIFSAESFFDSDIFDTSSLPAQTARRVENPSKSARRTASADFDLNIKNLFLEQQRLLSIGKRTFKKFSSIDQLKAGGFYMYDGMLCYVKEIGEKEKKAGGYSQQRMHVFFENGTESNMYRRSLAQRLYEGGFEIIDGKGFSPSGFIYVLKSLSEKDELKTIKDLYKIGFTKTTVQERIKGAEKDPTYLMSPVEVVAEYKIYTADPQKIEHILHTFLSAAQIKMSITDSHGNNYTPLEWYSVPLDVLDSVIDLLNNGQILDYHYNPVLRSIEKNP